MTKVRPPLSIEDALRGLIKTIGVDRARKATGRSKSYLEQLTNPDLRYRLTVDDAIKLDLEHASVSNGVMPILESYGVLVEAKRAERCEDAAELMRRIVDSVKEGGEAHAALIAASMPGASKTEKDKAIREWAEACTALDRCGPLIRNLFGGTAEPP
ncbi:MULTISPECIES: hypothetical protein [Sphingomonas]|uniref:Uncharacterized protein n=1 Tax=Sphingomonas molluscorum TaxID=418184 RepID=A0ABU8Q7M8_9SPHN|nr:hypothetical protein [Sphingomonas sp. JUb134]MBM7407085.1 hypothetical protein [Sphingomonas sp. JUb134]